MKIQVKKPERYTEHLSAFIAERQKDFLEKLAKQEEAGMSEVIRAVIDAAIEANE